MKNLLLLPLFITSMMLISCSGAGDKSPTGGGETTVYNVNVSVSPSGAGTISPSADNDYEEGETLSLQADAEDEYLFTGWSGDLEGADNPLSLTVDKDYVLTAHFEMKTYELSVATEGEGTVAEKVIQEKSKEYEHGTLVELTANPAEGYRFVEWKGAVTGSENPAQVTVDQPKEITAVFEKKSYALTIQTFGEGAVSEEVIQDKAKDYEHGTVVELTATPAEGYEFIEWQGALSSSENPAQITVDQPKEVTAVFEKKTYPLTITAGEGGSVEQSPDKSEYEHDSTVNLTAVPSEGYKFVEWQGDISSTENPLQVTMNGAKEITAVFAQRKFYRAANNVTILCPEAAVGATGIVDGVTYTKRTKEQITEANAATTCTSGITDMTKLFIKRINFNADISHWDVSSVTNMNDMFRYAYAFNGDIGAWDVSSVTSMNYMFQSARSFNQDISGWDVSAVTTMNSMFASAFAFNQDIRTWNVGAVTSMISTFSTASSFNQDISSWNVGSVTNMSYMFQRAEAFNQDLNGWNVSSVSDMSSMFREALSFNGEIGDWDVSAVTSMNHMFSKTNHFDRYIGDWDVSSVTDMRGMFNNAYAFNQNISSWDVSKVIYMSNMFSYASLFNQNLSDWNPRSVVDMSYMFREADAFNSQLNWDLRSRIVINSMENSFLTTVNESKVQSMVGMFRGANAFNQNLKGWCVTSIASEPNDFSADSPLASDNKPVWGTCGGS